MNVYWSWKFVLFLLFIVSILATDNEGLDDRVRKRKKRIVARKYVKRCNLNNKLIFEEPKSNEKHAFEDKSQVLEFEPKNEEPTKKEKEITSSWDKKKEKETTAGSDEEKVNVKKMIRVGCYVKRKRESLSSQTETHQHKSAEKLNAALLKSARYDDHVEQQEDSVNDLSKRVRVGFYVKKKKEEEDEKSFESEDSSNVATVDTSNLSSTQDRNQARISHYTKMYTDSEQLAIQEPAAETTLTANTTTTVYVTSSSQKKAFRQVDVLVIFNCTSGIFNVTSPLGVATTFTVDPKLYGNCTVYAIVPNNPYYLPSPPIITYAFIPIYIEGLAQNSYYTGEEVEIYLRPSNNAILNINVTITCGPNQKLIEVVTTIKPVQFLLPPFLLGNCTVASQTVIPFYQNFSPFEIFISPAIFFLRPAPNTQFKPGANILVNLLATNLNPDLNVTVELECNGNFVTSLTQNIRTTFVFVQTSNVYGQCLLSMADIDGYFTEQTIPITIIQVLSFALPKENQLIPPGTSYDLQVDGNGPVGSVSVLVKGSCPVGGIFFETVLLGQKKTVTMGSQFMGFCTLTATADNFVDASVSVQVYTPLTPEEMREAALKLRLDGSIVSKTYPFLEEA